MNDFTIGFLIAVFGILALAIEEPLWVRIPAAATTVLGMALMLSAETRE